MKKFSLLALAAAGLLFGACSEKDAVDNGENSFVDGNGSSYFTVNINLPSTPAVSTRAWDEDATGTLHDGLDAEWDVDNVLLLIYEGTDEETATLKQVVNPTTINEQSFSDSPNQITATTGKYLTKINNAPSGNLYVLAVVNGGTVIAYKDDNTVTVNSTDVAVGSTLAALRNASNTSSSSSVDANAFVYEKNTKKYFFMTNAVLSTVQGGTEDPTSAPMLQTLAPVDASKIYKTEADATASTAAAVDIYVERGAAKVTIEEKSGDFLDVSSLSSYSTGGVTISASFLGWSLDNTNKSSFPLHKVPAVDATKSNSTNFEWNFSSKSTAAATDKYRFIGGNPMKSGLSLYRTYWAEDPNYNVAYDAANFSRANDETGTTTFTAGKGDSNPKYCFENTFTVDQQITKNTTCAILKVQLSTSGFYSVGDDRTKLYTEDDVTNIAIKNLFNIPAFSNWFSTNAATGETTLTKDDVTITWNKAADVAGKRQISQITINKDKINGASDDVTVSTQEGLGTVITTVNSALKNVELFKDGISYYRIRIKHFGDDLTPWNSGEYETGYQPKEASAQNTTATPAETDAAYQVRQIAAIYPQATDNRRAVNYLGRYGMVRNNWYELEIGKILRLGSSTVPELDAHPDDELEELYINANINILSWAKRPQSWNLK